MLKEFAAEARGHGDCGIRIPFFRIAVDDNRLIRAFREESGERTVITEDVVFAALLFETEGQIVGGLFFRRKGDGKGKREVGASACGNRHVPVAAGREQRSGKRRVFNVFKMHGDFRRGVQTDGHRRSLGDVGASVSGAEHGGELLCCSRFAAEEDRIRRERENGFPVFVSGERMLRFHEVEEFESGGGLEEEIGSGCFAEVNLFHARPDCRDGTLLFIFEQVAAGVWEEIELLQEPRVSEETAERVRDLLERERREHGVHFERAVVAGVHLADAVLMFEPDEPRTGAVGGADLFRVGEVVCVGNEPVEMSRRNRIIGDERGFETADGQPVHSLGRRDFDVAVSVLVEDGEQVFVLPFH